VVGSARETVNRRLWDLEMQGLIALSPGRITILDRARLAAPVSSISPVA